MFSALQSSFGVMLEEHSGKPWTVNGEGHSDLPIAMKKQEEAEMKIIKINKQDKDMLAKHI